MIYFNFIFFNVITRECITLLVIVMEIKLVVLRQVMLFADLFGLPQNKVVPCGLLPFPKAVYKNERVKKTCPMCPPAVGVWAGIYKPSPSLLTTQFVFFKNTNENWFICRLNSCKFQKFEFPLTCSLLHSRF